MGPKRRKTESESKDEDSVETPAVEVEVKKERLSQDEEKDVSQQVEEKPTTGGSRTLRPRKSTCYVEKDSPEIEYEEKQKKGPRRKRRPVVASEDEKESKIKRSESSKDEQDIVTPSDNSITSLESDKVPQVDLPQPILVSCSVLNSDNQVSEKQNESTKEVPIPTVPVTKAESTKPSTEKKRPRPRKKLKPIPAEIIPLDPDLVPKTEPASPSSIAGKKEAPPQNGTVSEKPIEQEKPKPKKRIRKRKPVVKPAIATEDKTLESKSVAQGQEQSPVIKQEADETEGESKESVDGESKKKATEGKEDKDKINSTAILAAPKKKPARKRAKPQVKKISDADKTEDGSKNTEDVKTEKEIKIEDGNKEQKSGDAETQKPVVKKRLKPRSKKPTASVKIISDDGESKPDVTNDKVEEGAEKKNCVVKDKHHGMRGSGTLKSKPSLPVTRKPFFRGRRSKSISARSGRKEIIHMEETIDPEDIRGFEHVEKYVTPAGVRLPKFWDSEDEMSDDENSDNFRRIMCGFGTNCRIHEVIRPASEIVRRLKELQNTFGATKSLPLFQKDDLEFIEEAQISPSAEAFFRKDRERSITWHTDPSFFKYANNYPSKCK